MGSQLADKSHEPDENNRVQNFNERGRRERQRSRTGDHLGLAHGPRRPIGSQCFAMVRSVEVHPASRSCTNRARRKPQPASISEGFALSPHSDAELAGWAGYSRARALDFMTAAPEGMF